MKNNSVMSERPDNKARYALCKQCMLSIIESFKQEQKLSLHNGFSLALRVCDSPPKGRWRNPCALTHVMYDTCAGCQFELEHTVFGKLRK